MCGLGFGGGWECDVRLPRDTARHKTPIRAQWSSPPKSHKRHLLIPPVPNEGAPLFSQIKRHTRTHTQGIEGPSMISQGSGRGLIIEPPDGRTLSKKNKKTHYPPQRGGPPGPSEQRAADPGNRISARGFSFSVRARLLAGARGFYQKTSSFRGAVCAQILKKKPFLPLHFYKKNPKEEAGVGTLFSGG